jgi:hypothetical protein
MEPNKTTAKRCGPLAINSFYAQPRLHSSVFSKTVIETPTQDHESSMPLAKIKKRFLLLSLFCLYYSILW